MRYILIMGLLSFLGGLAGCRPSSATRVSSPQHLSDRIDVTAEFNHKIGPIDRENRYETPLNEALRKHGYGETDGGGTMQSKEGEIEFIDVHMMLTSPDTSIPFVIQFLNSCGAPKGSKLRISEGDTKRVVSFGVREGFAIYLDGGEFA